MTFDELCGRLRRYRYRGVTERMFQDDVATALELEGVAYRREVRAGSRDRFDFYLPEWQTALELKIDGGNSAVLRQLHRYSQQATVAQILLLTKHARHRGLPRVIAGKPLHVVYLWESAFA